VHTPRVKENRTLWERSEIHFIYEYRREHLTVSRFPGRTAGPFNKDKIRMSK
jgi:hypothetical protein